MTKAGKVRLIGAILLFLLAAAVAVVGFSKYITQLEGSGTIRVATWSFQAGLSDGSLSNTALQEIQLLPNNYGNIREGRVAPGTSGSFEMIADGSQSQVGIVVEVAFYRDQTTVLPAHLVLYHADPNDPTKPDKSNPVQVSQKLTPEEALLDASLFLSIPYSSQPGAMKKSFTIFWEWPYEAASGSDAAYDQQDQLDAEQGVDSGFGFQVVIRGVQQAPAA